MNTRYFFRTYETIPPGAGFPQFGACHLLWLLFAAVLWAAACLWYRRAPDGARRYFRLFIAGCMLLGEALKQSILLATGTFHWSYLPLHLCSINIFVCAAHALRPRRFAEEFLYAVCLPGPSWPCSAPLGAAAVLELPPPEQFHGPHPARPVPLASARRRYLCAQRRAAAGGVFLPRRHLSLHLLAGQKDGRQFLFPELSGRGQSPPMVLYALGQSGLYRGLPHSDRRSLGGFIPALAYPPPAKSRARRRAGTGGKDSGAPIGTKGRVSPHRRYRIISASF